MPPRTVPRARLWLLLVLLVAGGLRLGYLLERRAAPDFGHPEIDAGFHDDWARTLVFGEERAEEWRRADRDDPLTGEPYLRPPGYPWFLAGVYALTDGSPTAAVVANQLAGLLSVLLAFVVARRVAGDAAGLLAGGVLALHWALVYFEGELHAPALLGLLELGLVAVLLRTARGRAGWALGAGLLLGAAALVRPNALAFLAVAVPWLAWVRRRRGAAWGGPVLALVLGAGLAIAPATVRNWRVSGELVPITANLGINLYLGNHEGADGLITSDLGELGTFRTCYDYPGVVARLEEELDEELSLPEVSAHFGALAREWIRDQPWEFLGVTVRKARYLVGPAEIGHNKEVALEKRESPVLRLLPFPFPLLLGLAVLGGLLAWRGRADEDREDEDRADRARRREAVLLVAGLALVFALSLLPFFAAARYRVPLVPLLAPLIGMAAVGGRGTLLGWRGLVAVAVAGLAFAVGPREDTQGAKYHLDRAQGFYADGELERSRAEYELALELLPGDPGAHYGLAVLEQRLGNAAAARQHYDVALRSDPRHPEANHNLGFLHLEAGDTAGALERWRIAAEADPLFAPPAFQRGLLLLRLGRQAEARPALERAVERGRDGDEAMTYLTTLALLLATSTTDHVRDGTRALALAEEAQEIDADDPRALEARAAALAELGRFEEAARVAARALRGASGPVRGRIQRALASYRARRPMRM